MSSRQGDEGRDRELLKAEIERLEARVAELEQSEALLRSQDRVLEQIAEGRSTGDLLATLVQTLAAFGGRGLLVSVLLVDNEGKTLRSGAAAGRRAHPSRAA